MSATLSLTDHARKLLGKRTADYVDRFGITYDGQLLVGDYGGVPPKVVSAALTRRYGRAKPRPLGEVGYWTIADTDTEGGR